MATAATSQGSSNDEDNKSAEKISDEEEEKVSPAHLVQEEVEEAEPIIAFQSSTMPIAPELTKYLKERLKEPYNKYCLDCKINLSTHAICFFGIFVCFDCMLKIKNVYGHE